MSQIYTGLTEKQVLESRQKYGSNVLTPSKKEPAWKLFLKKFTDPLIVILLIAGFLSIGISCYEYFGPLHNSAKVFFEPLGIIIAILLATGLAFIFEHKADQEFSILNKVNDEEPVRVIRGANTIQIPKKDVVVGDIVILNTGDEVPADGILLEAVAMTIDESTLTGEPLCHKTTEECNFDKDATYPSNMALRGTKIMEGHGVMRVEKVGDATENGKVFVEAQIDNSVKTPLTEQLDRVGWLVSISSYAIGVLIIIGRCLMFLSENSWSLESLWSYEFGAYFLQTIMIAVTLVVVAVPEGLPMSVTLALAYSMRRMLKTNNLVRRMHACETMGAATVICTDKTGTLTQNQMRVYQSNFYGLPNKDLERIIDLGIGANTTASLDLRQENSPVVIGNPTEGALLLWLRDKNVDYKTLRTLAKVIYELPFSTQRKFMATLIEDPRDKDSLLLMVKGAPEIVMGMCSVFPDGITPEDITKQLLQYQSQAMRTLGFAYKRIPKSEWKHSLDVCTAQKNVNPIEAYLKENHNLEMLGIVAISDPVRAEVPEAVEECTRAGIKTKIVTGDTVATAKEIGRQIGLWKDTDTDEQIITGPEFEALSDDELRKRVQNIKIIARARPTDKRRLVESLQDLGEVVAVTGDGTNDAPALHQAHVGLSMGEGTSVAKEASDITIIDNSFSSIGKAVMWGRSLFQNIQRFILFQLTVNVAACFVVLAGAFMGTESPLTVTQMLWVNLIMDTFAAMALSTLPPSRSVMNAKPRDRYKSIITNNMWWCIFGVGAVFFIIITWMVFVFEHVADCQNMVGLFKDSGEVFKGLCNGTLTHYHLTERELSLIFTTFVMFQFWNIFNARAFMTGRTAFRLKGAGEFVFITICIFVGQILIVQFGGNFFDVQPISFEDWVIIVASTSLVLWVGELIRLFDRRHAKEKALAKKG